MRRRRKTYVSVRQMPLQRSGPCNYRLSTYDTKRQGILNLFMLASQPLKFRKRRYRRSSIWRLVRRPPSIPSPLGVRIGLAGEAPNRTPSSVSPEAYPHQKSRGNCERLL